jgi:hypothetical protein
MEEAEENSVWFQLRIFQVVTESVGLGFGVGVQANNQ